MENKESNSQNQENIHESPQQDPSIVTGTQHKTKKTH